MQAPFVASTTRDDMPQIAERILVVDDLPDNIALVQFLLASEGYRVETARSGEECLAAVRRAPPSLILLDVMMPGMDGYEVTRQLKADPSLPFLPILLVTASDRPSAALGLDVGADEFIRKPIEPDELLARVRSLLRLKRSIDDRDHAIEERDRAIVERDNIARQREDFVARLAHDLRTPLVAADRMFNLLLQEALGPLPPNMAETLTIMSRSNSNLLNLVRTLLDVYRYEAGAKQLHFQPTDALELVQQVLAEVAPLAEEKGLLLSTELESAPKIQADRLELYRVFTNLAGNAIKFTDQGSVTVRGRAEGNALVLDFIDTGPGIPAREQEFLFRRFAQGRHSKEGSGMGLHLSRQIVEAHGGTLSLCSCPGEGSTFTVRLPLNSQRL